MINWPIQGAAAEAMRDRISSLVGSYRRSVDNVAAAAARTSESFQNLNRQLFETFVVPIGEAMDFSILPEDGMARVGERLIHFDLADVESRVAAQLFAAVREDGGPLEFRPVGVHDDVHIDLESSVRRLNSIMQNALVKHTLPAPPLPIIDFSRKARRLRIRKK